MRVGVLGIVLVAALGAISANAADCFDARRAKDGFRLLSGGTVSEVRPQSDLIVQVSSFFNDGEAQTALFFRGLIEVVRTSKSKQSFMLTLSDLRALFPLKKGQRKSFISIWLDPRGAPSPAETTEILVAGQESLKVGLCEYKVFRVQSTLLAADGSKHPLETVLYSPELAVVLAKRYDEGTSQETTVGYEEIRPLN